MSGEILNIHREMANLKRQNDFLRHQNACIMQAFQINACDCEECKTTVTAFSTAPKSVLVSDAVSLPTIERNEENQPKVSFATSTPLSANSKVLKLEHNVNLFDDVLHVYRAANASNSSNQVDAANVSVTLTQSRDDAAASPNAPMARNVITDGKTDAILPPGVGVSMSEPLSPSLPVDALEQVDEGNASALQKKSKTRAVKKGRNGVRFVSCEEKSEMYKCFLENGLHETAKRFQMPVRNVSRHISWCKVNLKKLAGFSKKLRTRLNAVKPTVKKRLTRSKSKRRPVARKIKVEIVAPEESSGVVEQTPPKKVSRKRKHSVVVKQESLKGRRARDYSKDEKQAVRDFYSLHGRAETMKMFDLNRSKFTSLVYNVNIKKRPRRATTGDSRESFPEKLPGEDREDTLPGENREENVSDENVSSDNAHEDVEAERKPESKSNASTTGVKKRRSGGRKILTDEQEAQLHHVLRTLESQKGTLITSDLLAYAAKQIIKRSTPNPTQEIEFSDSFSRVALRRYRARKF